METDRHFFIEGLFVIGIGIAGALLCVWLTQTGHRDDVLYRIRFGESVSGLSLGDPVKFRGVDVGTVKAMEIDPSDPRYVQVDVSLRKDTPIKTDTKATLRLKGFTGVVFVELDGGSATGETLAAATPPGQVPVIVAEKSTLNSVIDQLPSVIAKFGSLEDQTKKVLTDVNSLTTKLKDDPSLLLRRPKEKVSDAELEKNRPRDCGARI